MKFSESLKKNSDFQIVYKKGKSKANKFLVMYVYPNHLEKNRIGISVSKKVGNSVVRHHLARLIRENYRLQEEMFYSGLDIVIVVRIAGKNMSFHEMRDSMLHLAKLHRILYKQEKKMESF